MYLLEEEMVSDELFVGGLIHALKRVEGTSEVIGERLASLDDSVHDIVSLLIGDTGTKREALEVSADSDTSGLDHRGVLLGEVSVGEALGVHVRHMLVRGAMLVVVRDDLVEELAESGVRVVGTGVGADAGVEVLDTRKDADLEADTGGVGLVLVLLPDLLGEILREGRVGLASGEESVKIDKFIGRVKSGLISSLGSRCINTRSRVTTSHFTVISMIEKSKNYNTIQIPHLKDAPLFF